ncbi:hypothetical protein J5TS2_37110 [Brevibacillus halotolerans]|uniref:hypothetical protein n=1 Tax=Brevibacillus halotolerans TaxID=1507437 RepID=UPI001B068232|nr:hypothetical protein [Brevibacillus halotolerans]GIO03043.1 hypothetical protein J5TS2_37110 [Brevibacillus halotolerans]
MKDIIKYVLSVIASPVCLLLVWCFNIRPFSYFKETFNGAFTSNIPDTAMVAIDLSIVLVVYNVIGKLIEKLERPVKVKISIINPADSLGEDTTKYTFGEHTKKLKITGEISYNSTFFKNLTTCKGAFPHVLEVHWNDRWLTVRFDERKTEKLKASTKEGKWTCSFDELLGEKTNKTTFEIPIFFNVDSDIIRSGEIECQVTYGSKSFLLNTILSWIKCLFMKIELKLHKIVLNRGD